LPGKAPRDRLSWIGAEFAALRHFARNGTDHSSHAAERRGCAVAHRPSPTRHRLTDPDLDPLPVQGRVTSY
jgi:hypothetical protein